jgi:peptidyl-prolyl cis-trans isomerase SurA
MNHNKIYIVIFFLLFAGYVKAQPPKTVPVDQIAAIVDDKIILLSDIESQLEQFKNQGSKGDPDTMRCQLLEGLLTQKLLVAQALIDSIQISNEDLESELDRRVRYFSNMAGGQQKLEQYYGKSILEIKDEFRDDIRQQMLAQHEQSDITKDIKVTPNEVRIYFNNLKKDTLPYYNSEVEIGQIVINPDVSPDVKQLAKQKIEDLRQRAAKGEDFSKLATMYSDDVQTGGGELGFTDRGTWDPSFEAAAFALKTPGQISPVIESKFGYHIIQLIERRGERINVRHILIIPTITSYDLAKAQTKADSIYKLITDKKMTFTEAATKFSEDNDSKNNGGMMINPNTNNSYFEINQLGQMDKQLALDVQKMEVGVVNPPTLFKLENTKTAYRIIFLKSKSKPHQANLKDDYDKIQANAQQDKQTRMFNEWLQSKIQKTYIKISSSFLNECHNLKKWNTAQ